VVAVPDPLRGITSEEFGALLMSVMLPEKLPADAGVNPTLKAEEPPGGTVSGSTNPEEVKPAPAREAWVTLREAVPGFRMVTVWLAVAATLILPKPRLDGATEICGWIPVPLREIVAGELVALLTTLTLPVTVPTAVGAKLAVSGRLWPAARVTPLEKPDTVNPEPVEVTCEMFTLPVPVLVTVTP